MIKDLVLYFLRSVLRFVMFLMINIHAFSQGCYSQEGDIVVLCAYLGQLMKVRDALSQEVAVVIDERDQAALDDQDGEESKETDFQIDVEHIKVAKRVMANSLDT
jgi:hypothetical protein